MTDNAEIFEGLTTEQTQAIIALINNKTIREASQESGIAESNIYRWLRQDNFKEALSKSRKEVMRQAVTLAQKGFTDAFKTLEDIHQDKEAPTTARVTAARAICEMGWKAYEQEEIIERIEKLEEFIEKEGRK